MTPLTSHGQFASVIRLHKDSIAIQMQIKSQKHHAQIRDYESGLNC